ncbi:MAG: RodZ domain-containing protein [Woeseia sp.]
MSDDSQQSNGEGDGGPVAGERLAAARRARDVSLHDVAKELHLDEHKVVALEQNRFEILGAPVFAKGYLRKYAELVEVPVDDVIADYYRLNRSSVVPPLITSRPRIQSQFSPVPWLIGTGVLLLVSLALWWWFAAGAAWFANRDRPSTSDTVATDGLRLPGRGAQSAIELPMRQQPQGEVAEDEQPFERTERTEPETVPAVQQPPTAQGQTSTRAPTTQGPATPAATSGADGLQLRLAFSGDCWTEVTDAEGRRLYFGLGAAGNEISVSGDAPLRVLLGNSNNVSVFVNGTGYPIPASARRGDTARLTLTDR